METNQTVPAFLREVIKTSGDMWTLGWCEANGGNISLRLSPEKSEGLQLGTPSEWLPTGVKLANLGSEYFMFTGTTRFLRNIGVAPEKNLGVIELDATGSHYRLVWGFEGGGRPTSELPAHLLSHSAAKEASSGEDHAIIHTHAPNLIALSYLHNLTTPLLSKLLWQSHVECVVGFPAGVEFIPWMMAGGVEIAEYTADALRKRSLALWQHHGIFARGRNLDAAFGLIHMADKAAEIYLKVRSAGGAQTAPSTEVVAQIAANFKVVADAEALAADTSVLGMPKE